MAHGAAWELGNDSIALRSACIKEVFHPVRNNELAISGNVIMRQFTMTRILSRLGVSYQIGLVGLIGVIGLVVVGIVYYFGSNELASAGRALEQSNSGLATLAEIKIDLLETRRAEKDFLLRRKEYDIKQHDEALAKFAAD